MDWQTNEKRSLQFELKMSHFFKSSSSFCFNKKCYKKRHHTLVFDNKITGLDMAIINAF